MKFVKHFYYPYYYIENFNGSIISVFFLDNTFHFEDEADLFINKFSITTIKKSKNSCLIYSRKNHIYLILKNSKKKLSTKGKSKFLNLLSKFTLFNSSITFLLFFIVVIENLLIKRSASSSK